MEADSLWREFANLDAGQNKPWSRTCSGQQPQHQSKWSTIGEQPLQPFCLSFVILTAVTQFSVSFCKHITGQLAAGFLATAQLCGGAENLCFHVCAFSGTAHTVQTWLLLTSLRPTAIQRSRIEFVIFGEMP